MQCNWLSQPFGTLPPMSGAIDYARIDAAAARQYGLVTLAQLDRAGVTPQTRRRLLTGQLLVRVRPRVYRLCGAPPSWQSSALAVVLNVGSPCVVSHGSAGVLWGLLDQRETCGPGRPARIQITCTSYCRLPGVESHRHTLAGSEVTVRLRIPVTTIERTIVDLATTARTKQVGEYMDDALRRQLTTPARLSAAGASLTSHGRRRVKPFLEALRDRGIGYDPGANPWEQSMDRLWDELGLPPAVRQYRVRLGRRTFKLDRAIVEEKIAVEWNGHSPHGERSKFDADSDRRALLVAAGWLPLDFTSRSSPDLIRETVLSAYRQRRGGH